MNAPTIEAVPQQDRSAVTSVGRAESGADVLLDARDLRTHFITRTAVGRAVDGVSFKIGKGRALGMVGESGCGKSITALSILRLVPTPPGRIVGGQIFFKGRDLLTLSEREMRRVRGAQISMIFQEPMTSLNPVFTVGSQVAEVFRAHRGMGRREAMRQAVAMLDQARIPDAERRAQEYPHQMSGGMRQRVMIAMALACRPDLLIADEPTTALDVTVQAQILALMRDLQREMGTSILMITHDLGIIAEICDDVAIMYAGQIVEHAPTKALYERQLHPYARGLMRAAPRVETIGLGRLETIPGQVPNPAHHPAGCRFHPRCPFVIDACHERMPELEDAGPGRQVRCLRWREIDG